MASFLESQIGLLERERIATDTHEVEDLIAFYLTALNRLESHLGAGGLSERDRPLVQLFQRWLNAARKVKELVRNNRDSGEKVNGYDELLRAINRCKPIAQRFNYFVELNGRLADAGSAPNGG